MEALRPRPLAKPAIDTPGGFSASPGVLTRLLFVRRVTALLIAIAVCGVAVPRADAAAPVREMTISAAKACTELTLFLPEGRGKTPMAGSQLKLNLVPVFSGKILHGTRDSAPAAASPLARVFVRALPPRLVGTVELRI